MPQRRKVLSGPKINNAHSTLIHAAKALVAAAKKDTRVTRVILGKIVPRRGGQRRLKTQYVPAGLKITVRSGGELQELYVYTAEAEEVRLALEETWEKSLKA
jgi:hypothetical protein